MNEQKQSEVLTLAEIESSIAGEVCIVCGRSKRARALFCATDYAALPIGVRLQLERRSAQGDFVAMFSGWQQHLKRHDARRQFMPTRGGELPYKSTDELAAAGYKYSDRGQCGSVRCLAPILWFWTPERRRLALDEASLQPHRLTCKDPGFAERVRESRRLQTAARRRRRAS